VAERIRELLGGEIQYDWFLELTASQNSRFYHYYHIWWLNNGMSDEEKTEICGTVCPFEMVPYSIISQIDSEDYTKQYYQRITLELIEKMIYNGVNLNRQITGSNQVMSMLTMVSNSARIVRRDLFSPLT
jgi:hypothetical protein